MHYSSHLPSFIGGASLTNSGGVFLYDGANQILQYVKTGIDSFNYLGAVALPSGYVTNPGQLSKDGLRLFFGASYNGGYDKIYALQRDFDGCV